MPDFSLPISFWSYCVLCFNFFLCFWWVYIHWKNSCFPNFNLFYVSLEGVWFCGQWFCVYFCHKFFWFFCLSPLVLAYFLALFFCFLCIHSAVYDNLGVWKICCVYCYVSGKLYDVKNGDLTFPFVLCAVIGWKFLRLVVLSLLLMFLICLFLIFLYLLFLD